MKVLVLSDLHVGSVFGIFPRGFKTKQGNEIKLNEGQCALLYYFDKMIDDIDKIDCLFLLGDLVQGLNVKESGRFVMPCDFDIQIDACIFLLKKIVKKFKKIKILGISGSPYHTSDIFSPEKYIIEELGGKFLNMIATVNLNDYYINISHGVSAAIIYRTTIMEREMFFSSLSEYSQKIKKIEIFVRGHWHTALSIFYPSLKKWYIQNACFQGYVPYSKSLLYYGKSQPDIGATIIELPKKKDIFNIKVNFLLYPLPDFKYFLRGIG